MDLQKEWEVARDAIAKADDRVQDVRKVGFGFITTLLTADTFILHKVTSDGPPFGLVLSVTVVTILLIVATRLIEKQQEILQRVVAGRAVVIERLCACELSDIVRP